jgi:hypothetical protein
MPRQSNPRWYNIHNLVRIETSLRLLNMPEYFRVDFVEPNLRISMAEDGELSRRRETRRSNRSAVKDLGEGAVAYESTVPVLSSLVPGMGFEITISGVTSGTTEIRVEAPFARTRPVQALLSDLVTRLSTVIMATKLLEAGLTPCHAAGVAKADRAMLFFGFQGTGKSILVHRLRSLGLSYIGDDFVIIEPAGTVRCFPVEFPPHPMRSRAGYGKYLTVRPQSRGRVAQIQPESKIQTVFILERGNRTVLEELEPEDALRRILLMDLQEMMRVWRFPISQIVNACSYYNPQLEMETLIQRHESCVKSFLRHADHIFLARAPSWENSDLGFLGVEP